MLPSVERQSVSRDGQALHNDHCRAVSGNLNISTYFPYESREEKHTSRNVTASWRCQQSLRLRRCDYQGPAFCEPAAERQQSSSWFSSSPPNVIEHLHGRNLERVAQSEDDIHRGTVLAPLENAQVSLAHPGGFGKTLLRESTVETNPTDSRAEDLGCRRVFFAAGHSCIVSGLGLYYL